MRAHVTRSRRCLYIIWTRGNSAHASAGGGGHIDKRRVLVPHAMCGTTGAEVGQGERRGTSGAVVQKRKGTSGKVYAAISKNGTRGRLTHAYVGQRVGQGLSSVVC